MKKLKRGAPFPGTHSRVVAEQGHKNFDLGLRVIPWTKSIQKSSGFEVSVVVIPPLSSWDPWGGKLLSLSIPQFPFLSKEYQESPLCWVIISTK